MTKSTIVLIAVLVVVVGVYVVYFTDLFQPTTIQILAQVRPSRGVQPGAPGQTTTYPVSFAFDHKLKLTEVRVVNTEDEATNKFPHALWYLIADSNSVPTKAILYDSNCGGSSPRCRTPGPSPWNLKSNTAST
jgi:hypothetical protein